MNFKFKDIHLVSYFFSFWSQINPRWYRDENEVQPAKTMIWLGVIDDNVIGPYFFHNQIVNARMYRNMLRNFVIPDLRRQNIDPKTIIFMQDGAPIHGTEQVRRFLKENFFAWIGRGMGATIAWPPRSPDFNPLDYFVWGRVRNDVKNQTIENLNELETKITNVIAQMPRHFIKNAIQNIETRIDLNIQNRGGHFEHLLH